MVKVTIDYTSGLDKFYASLQEYLDARYHAKGLTIDGKGDFGNVQTISEPHASDGIVVDGMYASTDGGATWVHVERLVK